jgi:hypothetical protein
MIRTAEVPSLIKRRLFPEKWALFNHRSNDKTDWTVLSLFVSHWQNLMTQGFVGAEGEKVLRLHNPFLQICMFLRELSCESDFVTFCGSKNRERRLH